MKQYLLAALTGFLLSQPGLAGQPDPGERGPAARARSQSFEPCRWWRYDFESRTHTCQSTGMRVNVYETREVDSMVRTLEQQIQQLERRVQQLEQASR